MKKRVPLWHRFPRLASLRAIAQAEMQGMDKVFHQHRLLHRAGFRGDATAIDERLAQRECARKMTIAELRKLVFSLTSLRSRHNFLTLRQDDSRQRGAAISRARDLLHRLPRVTLEEGLKKTIGHVDKLLVTPREAIK